MSAFDYGALASVLVQAEADIKANLPLSASPSLSTGDIATALKAAQPEIEKVDAIVKANPGYVRAAVRILAELKRQGVPAASALLAFANALPGGLDAAESWGPTITGMLAAIQPVPTWQPGPEQYRR